MPRTLRFRLVTKIKVIKLNSTRQYEIKRNRPIIVAAQKGEIPSYFLDPYNVFYFFCPKQASCLKIEGQKTFTKYLKESQRSKWYNRSPLLVFLSCIYMLPLRIIFEYLPSFLLQWSIILYTSQETFVISFKWNNKDANANVYGIAIWSRY